MTRNGVLILRKFATSTIEKTKRKQRRVSRYLAKLLASWTQQEEKLERRIPVCTPNNNSQTTIVPRVSYQIHERCNPEISGICASHY
jgi:Uma2 family endonuclease